MGHKSEDVRVKWSRRPVRLIHKGEQVSEIEWRDTKTRQCIPNDQIVFKKEK